MFLPSPFILMVGDDGVLLVPPHDASARASLYGRGHGEESARPIIETLRQHPRRAVLILADSLAQDFRLETLPAVGILDRRALLRRRLAATFPDALMATSVTFKRREALLACVHKNSSIALWLERLEKLPNPSGPVALLPLESSSLIKRLDPEAARGWAMMLSWERTGGFRQIVTHDGALIFTRLTPPLALDSSAAWLGSHLMTDIQASLDYLSRLGLTDKAALRFIAILPAPLHRAITALRLPMRAQLMVSPCEAAHRLRLPFAPTQDDPTADVLHAAWLARKSRPRCVLIQEETRRKHRDTAIQFWGRAAAILAWIVTLVFLGWQSQDSWRLERENAETQEKVATLQQELTQERATLAPLTAPLGRLRQALERRRLFATPTPTPWPLLDALSTALGPTRLARFDWQDESGNPLDETLSLTLRPTETPTPALSLPTYETARGTTPVDFSFRKVAP